MEYKLNITKKSVSIQVDIAFRYVFIYLDFLKVRFRFLPFKWLSGSLAAIDSKTFSRARDRKGVYTQNSKMAAQNGRMTTNFKPLFLGN